MKRLTVNAVVSLIRTKNMDAVSLTKNNLAIEIAQKLMDGFIETESDEIDGLPIVSVRLDVIVATPEEFRRAVNDEAMKYGLGRFVHDAQASITDYYPDATGVKKIWEDLK